MLLKIISPVNFGLLKKNVALKTFLNNPCGSHYIYQIALL